MPGSRGAGSVHAPWITALDSHPVRVLLADGDDARAVDAAHWLREHTPIRPMLLTEDEGRHRDTADLDVVAVPDLRQDDAVLQVLRRKPSGEARTEAEADALRQDPLALAAAHVAAGHADACVAGASRATADVIRAGIKVLGLRDDVTSVSSSFLMILPDGRQLAYGDCAVLPAPDEEQLADVAIATAATFEALTGQPPRVAMLSFSTLGSAEHPDVTRVRAATDLVRTRRPELQVDGELQLDAAIVESVASAKAPGSPVAGRANVLIFPNLSAGNIGYKLTERLAGATAIGPILQGIRAPLNDLSRGCSSMDIAGLSLVSALQTITS